MKSVSVWLSVVLLFALGGSARANKVSEARQHFESAQTHFAVGEFGPAGDEYLAAYKLKPDAALLYNAAQSYRLAGNQEKALILYKNYLQFYPNESNVAEVQNQIAKLKDAIAAAEKAKTSPPTDTAQPKPMPPAAAEPTPAPTPAATPAESAAPSTESAEAAPPKEATPVYKKWWLWTIVGGVVVAGAVTAAVLLTTSSGNWNTSPEVGPGHMGLGVRW